jgi:hypothetical protein
MKPKLKPPGTKRLKLNCDILLSTSAFEFIVRRHSQAAASDRAVAAEANLAAVREEAAAGAYTRPLFSSTLSRF